MRTLPPLTAEKVQEIWDVFNARSVAKMVDYFADDVTMQDAITPPIKGKQKVKELMEAWFKAFPDINYVPTTSVVSGDTVVSLYTATATFRAPLVTPDGTIPATKKRGAWNGAVLMSFDAKGKMKAVIDAYDTASFAHQFGIEMPS